MERKGRVYWFKESKKRKSAIIFNAGDELGRIYVYELKRELPATELEKLLKEFGYYMAWDITQSHDVP